MNQVLVGNLGVQALLSQRQWHEFSHRVIGWVTAHSKNHAYSQSQEQPVQQAHISIWAIFKLALYGDLYLYQQINDFGFGSL